MYERFVDSANDNVSGPRDGMDLPSSTNKFSHPETSERRVNDKNPTVKQNAEESAFPILKRPVYGKVKSGRNRNKVSWGTPVDDASPPSA